MNVDSDVVQSSECKQVNIAYSEMQQGLGYVLFVILTINYRTRCCQFQLTNHSPLEEHGSEAIVWNYLGLHQPHDNQSNEFNECRDSVLCAEQTQFPGRVGGATQSTFRADFRSFSTYNSIHGFE